MAVPTSLPCDDAEMIYRRDAQHVLKPTILLPTPPSSRSSRESSPSPITDDVPTEEQSGAAKKKRKKKTKKTAKAKETSPKQKAGESPEERPPVLCISRNKHWRYISSYHV